MEAGERRVAIVTGGDSGIGKATAVTLAERGFDVGITWHGGGEGARGTGAGAREKGGRVELARVDLEPADRAAAVIGELAAALGAVDALVNNAGTGHSTPFLD